MVVTLAMDTTVCSHITKVTATDVRFHTDTMHTSLRADRHTHRLLILIALTTVTFESLGEVHALL